MTFPAISAFYAGLFGLLFVTLSVWVVKGRVDYEVGIGDGGEPALALRIRSHANFAEYVPVALILVAFAEMRGAPGWTVHLLMIGLLAARIAHPLGMIMPAGSGLQKMLRGPGTLGTWIVILAASIALLLG